MTPEEFPWGNPIPRGENWEIWESHGKMTCFFLEKKIYMDILRYNYAEIGGQDETTFS